MGGGLMQLVAYGAQDVYLTGNPQITFFKVVYRRHTNFSVEPIQQVFNGAADFGRTVTCNLNRNGDLITNMYAVVKLNSASGSANWGYVRRLGYALIEETKVEIGGSKIDEQYGDWLNVWHELSHKVGQERGHAKMIGDVPELTSLASSHDEYTLYVPLAYWFNRHNGLALPLIALQYHDVRVTIQYRRGSECVNTEGAAPDVSMDDSYLLIDYVFLDSEERKRFAQASHEYLIEQLQFTGAEALTATNNKYRLNFNHPSKFLVWAPHLDVHTAGNRFVAYAADGDWEAAREKFAKLVWLASRTGLTVSSGNATVTIAASGSGSATDEVAVPDLNNSVSSELSRVADKVRAQLVYAQPTSSNTVAPANVANVVLLSNTVTAEDMTATVDELVGSGNATVRDFLNLAGNSVVVRDHFNYGRWVDRSENPIAKAKLQLNGHDRFQERDGNYFNYVQPHQHFSNTPADGVNVYSFALKPEEHQPSGTCNFSRIDNATLNVSCVSGAVSTDQNSNLNIYTVNYNVLRVMSGMAGTAYSN